VAVLCAVRVDGGSSWSFLGEVAPYRSRLEVIDARDTLAKSPLATAKA
jgi:hypothetical protein